MQRALQKLTGDTKTAADQVDAAFNKSTPKIDAATKSIGAMRAQTGNLAAQFQDIAVQLQGGASPFTVALQQGTQIVGALGQGAGGAKALGAALLSLVSPTSIVTIGLIALGGYAVKYGLEAVGAVNNIDEVLKKHAENLKALKDAYGEAGKGIETAAKESIAVLKALNLVDLDKFKKAFGDALQSAKNSMTDIIAVTDSIGGSTVIEQTSNKYAAFKNQIDAFRASVNAGKPDLITFRDSISEMIQNSPDEKVRKLGQELLEATQKAAGLAGVIRASTNAVNDLANAARALNDKDFAAGMKALGGTVSKNLTDREKILKNYDDVMKNAKSDDQQIAAMAERDNQLAILSYNDRKKAAKEAADAAESAAKKFQGALDSSSKRTAQVAGETEALGKGAGQIAKLETQYRLTEQAQQAFGKVTPEIATKIDAVATAAGNAADALAKAKVNSQIEFNTKTALLSDEDVKIAQQLVPIYGNDIPAALGSTQAAAIRANDALKDISGKLQSSLVTGLADIVDGTKSASQGFADLGKSILRMLTESAIKAAIIQPIFGAIGLSGIGSLIPKFASGTDYAPGGTALVGEKGPELVNLPRGSQVIPAAATAKALNQGGGGTTIQYSIDARGADSGTVARIQSVLAQHARAIAGQGKAMQSAQRSQLYGVG